MPRKKKVVMGRMVRLKDADRGKDKLDLETLLAAKKNK